MTNDIIRGSLCVTLWGKGSPSLLGDSSMDGGGGTQDADDVIEVIHDIIR